LLAIDLIGAPGEKPAETADAMRQDGGIEAKPARWRRPPLPVVVLMLAAVFGAVGIAWSQRELVSPGERGALAEGQLESDPIRRTLVSDAAVRWRFDPDGAFGPEIVADIAIPERRQNITFAIRRNTDDQLAASYIIEVVAEPPTFPGRNIAAIPLAYAKPSPDSRGTRLIGAAATVAENRFWFALSSERFDVNANRELLRGAGVFELTLAYDTGRSAALLFEKGESGRRAFEAAAPLWDD
jgi:hypothetical protein